MYVWKVFLDEVEVLHEKFNIEFEKSEDDVERLDILQFVGHDEVDVKVVMTPDDLVQLMDRHVLRSLHYTLQLFHALSNTSSTSWSSSTENFQVSRMAGFCFCPV
jgi:hypothetical protein